MRNYWFPNRKGGFFVQARKPRVYAETYNMYAAQEEP